LPVPLHRLIDRLLEREVHRMHVAFVETKAQVHLLLPANAMRNTQQQETDKD
jgi:hypothetical protein